MTSRARPSLFLGCVLAIGALVSVPAGNAVAGKTTVVKISTSTTVHAVLTSQGTPTGAFEGKVSSGFAGCIRGATVVLSGPPGPGDLSGLTEFSANRTVKPDGTWEMFLGEVGSPLVVQVEPLGVFRKVSKHKTIQCKRYKKSVPTPTS